MIMKKFFCFAFSSVIKMVGKRSIYVKQTIMKKITLLLLVSVSFFSMNAQDSIQEYRKH